jgi:hypothetical protein
VGARPEEIRSEIEETRDRISAEIDELTDRYSPGRMVHRRTAGARDTAASMRAKVGSGATGIKERLAPHPHGAHSHPSGDGEAGAAGAHVGRSDHHPRREEGQMGENRRRRGLLRHRRSTGAVDEGVISRTSASYTGPEPYPSSPTRYTPHAVGREPQPGGYPDSAGSPTGQGPLRDASVSSSLGGPPGEEPAGGPVTYTTTTTYRTAPAEGGPMRSHATQSRSWDGATWETGRTRTSSWDTGDSMARREQQDADRFDQRAQLDRQLHRSRVREVGAKAGQAARGHAGELGLATASAAMVALGARLLRHPSRTEEMLAADAVPARYAWIRPAEQPPKATSGMAAPSDPT